MTHALHVLPLVDRIIVVDDGRIVEEGTYAELTTARLISASANEGDKKGTFKQLIDEYGSLEKATEEINDSKATSNTLLDSGMASRTSKKSLEGHKQAPAQALMTIEDRATGAVTAKTYAGYFKAGGSLAWGPMIALFLVMTQSAQVANNLFLGWWASESLPGFNNADYMGAYAGLGAAQAIMTFITSFSISLLGLKTSFILFGEALNAVLRSPVSFFDTTPMGRIISRLSKDQDTLDDQLPFSAFQFFSTISSVFGTVFLVFYTFPLLGTIFAPLLILYVSISTYYRFVTGSSTSFIYLSVKQDVPQ